MSCSRLRPAEPVASSGALPSDALFEVLLRVPAKDLCRLRAVCRSWHALTSDPHFAAAHKSRHREPLFASIFRDGDSNGVAIFGMSGQVLRRIPVASDRVRVLRTHLDRVCVIRECKPSLSAWVVNPATGAALTLPGLESEEFVGNCIEHRYDWGSVANHFCKTVTYAFGQVVHTGQYKMFRISHHDRLQPLLCDIITIDGNSQGSWRRKKNPPSGLMKRVNMHCLAFNGVIYFLFDYAHMEPDIIALFDLDTESWMPTLQGPEQLRSVTFRVFERELSLANLNGFLVTVDNVIGVSFDLWYLMDHERSLWVKKYG